MGPSLNIALSGFNAANQRLTVAAQNLANQQSTTQRVDGAVVDRPYQPQEVVQSSQANGGVSTEVRPRDNATVDVYQPENPNADDNGVVQYPNVDTAEELVNARIASYDAKANLKLIKIQDDLFKNTLDIIT